MIPSTQWHQNSLTFSIFDVDVTWISRFSWHCNHGLDHDNPSTGDGIGEAGAWLILSLKNESNRCRRSFVLASALSATP